ADLTAPRMCNRNATHFLRAAFLLTVIATAALSAEPVFAQSTGTPTQPNGAAHEHRKADIVKFLAGAALALAAHEGGHVAFDFAFGARPHLARVEFGGIPFFAIEHRNDLSPRREFTIDSAGFWVQESVDEVLLTRRPMLRDEHAPIAAGVMAFNILTSIGYGTV